MTNLENAIILSQPCTYLVEHSPHAFLIVPLHNLMMPRPVTCPGFKIEEKK